MTSKLFPMSELNPEISGCIFFTPGVSCFFDCLMIPPLDSFLSSHIIPQAARKPQAVRATLLKSPLSEITRFIS